MSTAEIIAELPHLSSAELAQVQAKLSELVDLVPNGNQPSEAAVHAALRIWKDRLDLPDDSIDASHVLRERMMGQRHSETDFTKIGPIFRSRQPLCASGSK
jgi:hypothetical protein